LTKVKNICNTSYKNIVLNKKKVYFCNVEIEETIFYIVYQYIDY